MNDEEFEQLVRSALRPRKPPEITDEGVADLLAPHPEHPPGTLEKVRANFLGKVFRKYHPEIIWQVPSDQQFGPWFRGLRENVRLPVGEIAAAIEEPRSFLETLEQGEVRPWELDPDGVAKLMILYRVHFYAAEALVKQAEGATVPPPPPPRETRAVASELHAMMIDRGGPAAELIPEAARWLEALRNALRKRKARSLLDMSKIGITFGDLTRGRRPA
jgi:hypothetical protein